MDNTNIPDQIIEILHKQLYGVYSTVRNQQPHSSLVSFAVTPDLAHIVLLTPKNTRKYINTQINHHITLFISTATNDKDDLEKAVTLAITGTAEVGEKLDPKDVAEYRKFYLEKNSYMTAKADTLGDLILITVDHYELVNNFQQSIIQAESDMKRLKIRQMVGTSLNKGLVRGKAVHVTTLTEIVDHSESKIVIIEQLTSEIPGNFKAIGLVVGQKELSERQQAALKKLQIPILIGLGSSVAEIQSGQEISINGNLGLLIFHEIKS